MTVIISKNQVCIIHEDTTSFVLLPGTVTERKTLVISTSEKDVSYFLDEVDSFEAYPELNTVGALRIEALKEVQKRNTV
jgi:hypothetical protein